MTGGDRLTVLGAWHALSRLPGGRALFTGAVCLHVPYFANIHPHVEVLRPGRCEVRFADRRAVHNHLGTVHAIALCNAAEIAAGLTAQVTTPRDARWIPVGMTTQYRRRARGRLRAVATVAPIPTPREPLDVVVDVEVRDRADLVVMSAAITMRVSARPRG